MNIYESITGIMQEGYTVTKAKRNQQQGFMYRGIDDVMNTFQPLMSKYKVFCVPEVLNREREERTTNKGAALLYSILTVKYTFYAEDGTSVSAVVIGEGMDSGDKASNKAMAVAMKYAMFQVFCIPTEEMPDPDKETPPPSKRIEDINASFHGDPPKLTCDNCSKVILGYKADNGMDVTPEKLIADTKRRFGKALCRECAKKAFEAQAGESA